MVYYPGKINGACSPALIREGRRVHSCGMLRRAFALLALVALAAAPAAAQDAPAAAADEAAVRQLNSDYVRAFLACDVARFRTLLSDDFMGVLADGRVIDKAAFLALAKDNLDAHDLRLRDLVVRPYGDTVLVGAVVSYTRSGGAAVRTRYSSLYVRRDGRWSIAWTQWTRVAVP
jgi:ketosteroid isomerase-like protein